MAYEAKVIADSVSEAGDRLTTIEAEFPRLILAEFNTHRVLSRNSASSRAIPVVKQLSKIMREPFVPTEFGVNKPGMQAGEPLEGAKHDTAVATWLSARDDAVLNALRLMTSPDFINKQWKAWQRVGRRATLETFVQHIIELVEAKDPSIFERHDLLGVHKGLTNRILEPFMWHTVIVTATEWRNFFALRTSTDAQLEIRTIANLMQEAINGSTPEELKLGDWHLPYIQKSEKEWARANPEQAALASSARCARVSYLTHDTGEANLEKDLVLAGRLSGSGHMSPFEHVATPYWEFLEDLKTRVSRHAGNFLGWKPYRKFLPHEDDFSKVLAAA